jgi:hypothetical protein
MLTFITLLLVNFIWWVFILWDVFWITRPLTGGGEGGGGDVTIPHKSISPPLIEPELTQLARQPEIKGKNNSLLGKLFWDPSSF